MAIMAILVLLAAPKYLNYVKDAEVIAMEADIRLIEDIVERNQIEDPDGGWPVTDEEADLSDEAKDAIVDDYVDAVGGEDYPKTEDGEPDKDVIIDLSGAKPVDPSKIKDKTKNTKDAPSDYVIITKGPLKGEIYHKDGYEDSDGKYRNGLDSLITKNKDKDVKKTRYVMATDRDFEFIPDTSAPDGVGYFHYIGDGEYIIIPNVISEIPMTSYYKMFNLYSGDQLKGVASYNSNIINMSNMFKDCSQLTSLDLSNFDTSNVTDMSYMFGNTIGNSSELISLDISNFDTSNVIDMSNMFEWCNSLTSLDVSNFNTSKVTNMNNMFCHCCGLTSLDVSGFDTSNVTSMKGMFDTCYISTPPDLSNFDTSNVTDMSYMFSSCNNLTSLDVNNFDTSNVTDMSSMFRSCPELISLDVSNFDTSNVTNMASMFSSCKTLTELNTSNFNTAKVTDISGMFTACNSLTSLNLSNFDTSNVTNMNSMIRHCYQLISLDLSSFNTSKVTDMGYMFNNSNSLTSLDLSNFDTSNVTAMRGMFGGCDQLTSLDLSSFDTSSVTNMDRIFKDCTKLTTVYTRTQNDANRLNSSSNKPSSLQFIAKE